MSKFNLKQLLQMFHVGEKVRVREFDDMATEFGVKS